MITADVMIIPFDHIKASIYLLIIYYESKYDFICMAILYSAAIEIISLTEFTPVVIMYEK